MEGVSGLYSAHSLIAVIGFLLLYTITVAVYRLSPFHPLAKYPGPLLDRVTGWSTAFRAASGAGHLKTRKLHEVYGPIVRIGPNAVSINTIQGLQEIYSSRNANVQKTDWYRTVGAGAGGFSTHSETDRQKHAFRRRVLEHAFSESALRSAEEFVHDNVNIFCQRLGEGCEAKSGGWSTPKNMSDWCTYLGYDIMGDLMFGERFNCIGSDEHRYVPGVMMDTTKFLYILGYLPCISLIRPLLGTPPMNLLGGEMSRRSQKYIEHAGTQMARRMAREHDKESGKQTRKDFSHYIINAKDPQTGRGLPNAEIYADSSLLISAGSDTTAAAMSTMLFYLLRYPAALKKLVDNIRSAFSSVDEINGITMSHVGYLRACIDEALRLSPPIPSLLPREVLPGGLTVNGHYFPPGTVVGTSAYAIHHNPEYYPEPFKYYPERWVADENAGGVHSANAVALARAAFCPFSSGRRGCIGKNIAYRELEIAIGKLLYIYDIRLPENRVERQPTGEGSPHHENLERHRREEYQLEDYFLPIRNGPTVQFRAVAAASD